MTAQPVVTCHDHEGWRPPANKSVTLAWRGTLLDYLRDQGVTTARAPEPRSGVPGPFGEAGEIAGVDGWTLLVQRCKTLDLSGSADEAKRRADRDGSEFWATLLHRKAKDPAQAYVLLDVDNLTRLLSRLDTEAEQ